MEIAKKNNFFGLGLTRAGISYPDISLLLIIADYFGVSVDCLLGHDAGKQAKRIAEVCSKADALFTEGRYMQSFCLHLNFVRNTIWEEAICLRAANFPGIYRRIFSFLEGRCWNAWSILRGGADIFTGREAAVYYRDSQKEKRAAKGAS